MLALLREQHDAGQTIVMVTHDPRVGALADRLLLMEDGRFTAATTALSGAPPTLQDLSALTP